MGLLRLALLGSPQLYYDEQPVVFPTRKALALLVYLVVEGGMQPRDKLLTLLWPDSGRGTLRSALLYVRQGLDAALPDGSGVYLQVEPDAVGFNDAAPLSLDTEVIQVAVQSDAPQAWQQALSLAGSHFLDAFSLPDAPAFDEWVTLHRAQLDRQVDTLFDKLTAWHSVERRFEAGIALATRWIAHNTFHEAAYRRLMELQALSGAPTAALQTYATCASVLRAELGVTPAPETQALAERIKRGQGHGPQSSSLSQAGPPPETKVYHGAGVPLVGRNAEHNQLVSLFEITQSGCTQVVIVEGEPGIGKTRLATEFTHWLSLHGADVLTGRAFEAGGRLPYQPLVDALRRRIEQEHAPDDLLSDVWLAELSRLLPELRERYPDLPEPTGDEALARTRLPEAVARLGRALSEQPPATGRPTPGLRSVVIWLDDLQWADVATLDVLLYCVRAWETTHLPILLLLTLRPEAMTPELSDWLDQVNKIIALTRMSLGPITAQETVEWVNHWLKAEPLAPETGRVRLTDTATFAAWLFGETAGQPFFIGETLKALREQSASLPLAGRPETSAIPPGVRQLILTRLKRLSEAGMAFATASAVLGRPASFDQLCQVAGLGEADALRGLDETLGRQLMLETSDEARPYTYSHDKIRDVVYAEAGSARRRLFHRRALEALERAAASPAELSRHALAAELLEPAFYHSLVAGDEAIRLLAPRAAIPHYEQARTLGQQIRGVSPSAWRRLYDQLGRAYEVTNARGQARLVYQAWLDQARRLEDAALECTALNRLATVLAQDAYDLHTAIDLLRQAVQAAERSGDQTALAETEWSLAQVIVYTFDLPSAYTHARRALALSQNLDLPELQARVLNTSAFIEGGLGLWDVMEEHATEAIRLCRLVGQQALEADSMCAVARARINTGRAGLAIDLARTAHAMNLKSENHWGAAVSAFHLAFALMECGALEEALPIAQQGVTPGRQLLDFAPLPILNLTTLGNIYRAQMNLETARAVHHEALVISESWPQKPLLHLVTTELYADYALSGAWDVAYHYARYALTATHHSLLHGGLWHWLLVEALLRGGDEAMAREETRRFGERYGANPRYQLPYYRSLAVLAAWDGQPAEAKTYLDRADALAEALHLPNERSRQYDARPGSDATDIKRISG